MNATPSSEKSVYFDAPVTHAHMPDAPTTEGVPAAPLTQSPTIDAPVAKTPVLAANAPTVLAQENPASESTPASDPPSSPVPQTDAERAEARDVVDPNDIPEPKTSPTSTISPGHHGRAASLGYAPSLTRPSVFTNADGQTIAGSTFINGAGTTGPNATAEHNESLHQRAASADAVLSGEQKAMIAKNGG
jgi:hypothetical protein